MKTITTPECQVIWFESWGQHATDLVDFQKILNHTPDSDNHAVAITLEATKGHIWKLIHDWINRENIVSLASLMRESPGWVMPLHFLFWAGATGSRKMAIGMNRTLTPFAKSILDRSESLWIDIIETDVPRHDLCSGYIQWLTNFLQLLIWDTNGDMLREICMQKWKASPSTVFGLMYNNSDAELAIIQFFENLSRNNNQPLQTFIQTVEENLSQQDIDDFGTPNFERMFNFAQNHESEISIDEKRVQLVREHLNSDGELWLPKEIQRIRKTIEKTIMK